MAATFLRRTVVLLAFALVVAAPARADVYDDNPATASRGANDRFIFIRAGDGSIYERHWTGANWTGWSSLGGNATSGPAAVAYGGALHVFVRGLDGATLQNTLVNGNWTGWTSLGGYSTSAPAVTVRRGSVNYLDLVVRGGDSQMWHQSYVPGVGWSGFAPIGGNLTSAATVNSQAPGLLNIWARGTDGAVYQKSWTGSAWTDWLSIAGGIVGAPTSVSRSEGVINVYARGAGNATFQRSWNSTASWGDWFRLDAAAIDSSPAAGSDGSDVEYLVARHGTQELVFKEWTATTGWSQWKDLGKIELARSTDAPPGPPASTPSGDLAVQAGVACTPPNGRLRVSVSVRKPKGKTKPRVTKIVFYTKGKGRKVRIDRKAPFEVRIPINRPAGSTGRVYARVYYKRSAHGKTFRKVVSRRYKVCR
jgi:hypothetical protein